MKSVKILFTSLMFILAVSSSAQTKEATPEFIQKEITRGKQYCLLLLKSGREVNQDSAQAAADQMNHLMGLFNLKLEGKLPLFGPVMETDSELRGIGIFNIADKEEVKKLIEADPHIKSGALKYELYQWFGLPGDALP